MLPAVDLLGGRVVRLHQGRYDRATAYPVEPVELARRYAAAGAAWLHVVDLDAARTGERSDEHARLLRSLRGGARPAAAARRRHPHRPTRSRRRSIWAPPA